MTVTSLPNNNYFNNLSDFSDKFAGVFASVLPTKASITQTAFNQLGKKSQELYDTTNNLIETLDSKSFEEINRLKTSMEIVIPMTELIKNFEFEPHNNNEKKLIENNQNNIITFKRSMYLVSDLFEAVDQYIKDSGNYKISEYMQLISDYKDSKEENLALNEEFKFVDSDSWK